MVRSGSCLCLAVCQMALPASCVFLLRCQWPKQGVSDLHRGLFWFIWLGVIWWNQKCRNTVFGEWQEWSQAASLFLRLGISPWLDTMELPQSDCCNLACSGNPKEGKSCQVTWLCGCCTSLLTCGSMETTASRKTYTKSKCSFFCASVLCRAWFASFLHNSNKYLDILLDWLVIWLHYVVVLHSFVFLFWRWCKDRVRGGLWGFFTPIPQQIHPSNFH